LLVVSGSWVRP